MSSPERVSIADSSVWLYMVDPQVLSRIAGRLAELVRMEERQVKQLAPVRRAGRTRSRRASPDAVERADLWRLGCSETALDGGVRATLSA